MQKKKLVLIGGGGHCKACIDVVECTGQYEIIGILDHDKLLGTNVLGYKIIGSDNDIAKYKKLGIHFLITVGQIRSAIIRNNILNSLEQSDCELATVISPYAYVSKHASIGKGTIVMHGAKINAASVVGLNCILNTGCNIEHDTVIGNSTHISTYAVINGGCIIGNDVFVGSNATVSNGINITDDVVLGAASFVNNNIEKAGTYVGNPLIKIK